MKISAIVAVTLLILLIIYILFNYFTMKDVKTPEYKVKEKHDNIEIREYPSMLIAQVKVSGSREDAANDGFKQLASFIFGDNQRENADATKIKMTAPVLQEATQKIPMTAPVLQTQSQPNQWVIKFIMPSNYTLKTLPKPNNKNIELLETPAKKMIVIQFSGTSSLENLAQHQKQLEDYIAEHHIQTQGNIEYAFYNPPWTLPMQRRNEISFTLQ